MGTGRPRGLLGAGRRGGGCQGAKLAPGSLFLIHVGACLSRAEQAAPEVPEAASLAPVSCLCPCPRWPGRGLTGASTGTPPSGLAGAGPRLKFCLKLCPFCSHSIGQS